MAFTPLVPVTLNIAMSQGLAQAFKSSNVKDFAGANVDLSAWVSLTAKVSPITAGVTTSDSTFGTVTADANGIITLTTAAGDLASATPGTANLIISGKPTAGDGFQVLARGSLTLQAS